MVNRLQAQVSKSQYDINAENSVSSTTKDSPAAENLCKQEDGYRFFKQQKKKEKKEQTTKNSARLRIEVGFVPQYKYIYINTSSLKKTLLCGPLNINYVSHRSSEVSLRSFVIVVQNEQLIVGSVITDSLWDGPV